MKHKMANKLDYLISNNHIRTFTALGLLTVIGFFISEPAYADDAFEKVYEKLADWIGGGAGKVITLISIGIAGIMGALGFSGRHVAGALGVGLLLSLATSIVDMIFD